MLDFLRYNLGLMHSHGDMLFNTPPANLRLAVSWLRKAAGQGHAGAADSLASIGKCPLTTKGVPVVLTGLTAKPEFNGRTGIVVASAPSCECAHSTFHGTTPARMHSTLNSPLKVTTTRSGALKPGRVAVLLDGDTNPTSIREANLRKADGF